MYHGRFNLLIVSTSASSSHDRDEHVEMVLNELLSRKDEKWAATVMSTGGDEDGLVGSTLKER